MSIFKESRIYYISCINKCSQMFSNYDYVNDSSGPGTSVFRDMTDGKINSIQQWRALKRKQRKKNLKRIKDQNKLKLL